MALYKILLIILLSPTFIVDQKKVAVSAYSDVYFLYDKTSGNQFDPTHYTEIVEITTNEFICLSGNIAMIRVKNGDETFLDGSSILRPKVDADDANSTIHSDLVASQNSTDNFYKITNRVWIECD